jgi:cellulose synthase/poly-beta-1,6-N-acetylglucosamine synthase-like glycosyltransferase
MAVHNEEKIIQKKIESIINSDYDLNKYELIIGSDASSDSTDKIIKAYIAKYGFIKFKRFEKRTGKIGILNNLVTLAENEILILTDANAILNEPALKELVKHFKNPEIKLVGGYVSSSKSNNKGVSIQENMYMENENFLKYGEGLIWGTMIGAFGAFYALRKTNYVRIPNTFLVDDFFISMKALQNGGKAILEPKAIANENVPGTIELEFKRKSRISTGNFQNLSEFYPFLFSKRKGLAFSFLSHKVLRWFGPFFLLAIIICSAFLFLTNLLYNIVFIIITLSLFVAIIDFFMQKTHLHIITLRFITHFYYMNAALLVGLINYLKGVKTNVWEPTKRS